MAAGGRTAIVLAGGLGTRLRSAVPDVPKVLAPVAGRPFLAHLLESLEKTEFDHVVLAVGYRRGDIIAAFGRQFGNLRLDYSVEEKPLGTGGAVWLAARQMSADQDFFVFNGDTYATINCSAMELALKEKNADMAITVHAMQDTERYGLVDTDNEGFIKAFHEKKPGHSGLINAGVYLMRANVPNRFPFPESFSFEKDFMQSKIGELRIAAIPTRGYFIDIGIPEDYKKANRELAPIGR